MATPGSTARELLAQARLYLCTDARAGAGDFGDFVEAAYAGGVDIIQLRDKTLEAREELGYLAVLRTAAERWGRLWAVNDRADVAYAAGAPVLHLGQDDLPVAYARRLLGPDVLIGRSTHSPAQFDAAAAEPGVDYVVAGPTWATPTKPGRPAAGLSLLDHAAAVGAGDRPWWAIGGIEDLSRLDTVIAHGARRVVVVRAITQAADPAAAARSFATRLTSPA
ncbi:thiamine phosphate synthase [Hamadaea tsunoensis]|uniref:thiamine phosphate synthase n=1 Tax=Hamadaea tsunoensis TaxID=53368 RepID=UPI0004219763|nr:thiamine phosphate synthase [Hamadaea tsunoensis]